MLLAIDTSTALTGLALYNENGIIAEQVWTSRQHHTAELAPAVDELLRRGGLSVEELQALGVALGPGSFTSLRVGLAFVKGLALSRRLPLIGIPTLDAVAAAQTPRRVRLAAVLQAGRGRLAVGWYRSSGEAWSPAGEPSIETLETLAAGIRSAALVCGELTADQRAVLAGLNSKAQLASPAACLRRPGMLAELAWQRWQRGESDDPAALAPLYLHIAEPVPG